MNKIILLLTVFQAIHVLRGKEEKSTNSSNVVACSNGDLLMRSQICDGVTHCSDGSDEIYSGSGFKCSLTSLKQDQHRRRCVLPQSMIKDDVIDCDDATDGCFDSNGDMISHMCYRCFDRSFVISLTQVCDGVIDCPDLSDECVCLIKSKKGKRYGRLMSRNPICRQMRYAQDIKAVARQASGRAPKSSSKKARRQNVCPIGQIQCRRRDSKDKTKIQESTATKTKVVVNETVCVTVEQLCNGVADCPMGDDEMYCPNPNYTCLGTMDLRGNFCDGRIDCPHFDDECSKDCWLLNEFCDDVITTHDNISALRCNSEPNATTPYSITSSKEYVTAYDVCNGVQDCPGTSNDEANCLTSTHFYCVEESPLFINWSQRVDGVRDCNDGSDECVRMFNSSRDNLLRHRDALVRNPFLVCFMWMMGAMALIGNAVVMHQTIKELWKDRDVEKLGKLAKCNRIFVFNLALADFLMGIHLIAIAIETAITDGNYCVNDRLWRSSLNCVMLGCINQISCEASVFMLILMTSYRLYGTMNPFKIEKSATVFSSVAACVVVWIIAISIAVVPLMNINYFSEAIWMPLPSLPRDEAGEPAIRTFVVKANTLTHNYTGILPDLNWTTLLKYMSDLEITGVHAEWSLDKVRPFGFYNRYPNCIPNLYPKLGDTAWGYAAAVIIFNFCGVFYIMIAYFVIYKASSRPAVRKSVRKRSRQWRRDNKTMQKKIFFLVVTDVACWFPICVIFALNLAEKYKAEGSATDFTGAVLLPINSAINPLIYSNALWKLLRLIRTKICPKAGSANFLPYNSFRNKFDSVSSNETNLIRKRTVKFADTEESTDYSGAEAIEFQGNDVSSDVGSTSSLNDSRSSIVTPKFSIRRKAMKNARSIKENPRALRRDENGDPDGITNNTHLVAQSSNSGILKSFLKDPSPLLDNNKETIL